MRSWRPLLAMFLLQACTHDALDDVKPRMDCITNNVSYSGTIAPIIQTRCALSGCHVAGGNGTGNFTTYAGVLSQVNSGKLVPAVQRSGGAIPMPPDGSRIPECEIMRIVAWVNAGAPEN